MAETSHRQSAKMYRFPSKPRVVVRKLAEIVSCAGSAKIIKTDFGSGWYHDAAMADEAHRRKP